MVNSSLLGILYAVQGLISFIFNKIFLQIKSLQFLFLGTIGATPVGSLMPTAYLTFSLFTPAERTAFSMRASTASFFKTRQRSSSFFAAHRCFPHFFALSADRRFFRRFLKPLSLFHGRLFQALSALSERLFHFSL